SFPAIPGGIGGRHSRFFPLFPQFFSVFAFATLGGFQGSVSYRLSCAGSPNTSVSAAYAYPFRAVPTLTSFCP
uniref:Uncharacterized protein n=1 Tax=Amazona collaria TaxID=241587 RepID=A0A8B9FD50_9PSIT